MSKSQPIIVSICVYLVTETVHLPPSQPIVSLNLHDRTYKPASFVIQGSDARWKLYGKSRGHTYGGTLSLIG